MSGSIDARDQDFELRPPSEEDLKLLHSVRPALESAIKTRGSQFFAEKPSHGLSGLVNQGATCYLNSLVQALFHSPDFRKRVYEWRNDPGESAAAQELSAIPAQLQALFAGMQLSRAPAQTTGGLTEAFGWGGADAFKQHDVQELLHLLLEAMENSYTQTRSRLQQAAGEQDLPAPDREGASDPTIGSESAAPRPLPSEDSVEAGEEVALRAAQGTRATLSAYLREHLVWDLLRGYSSDHIACTHEGCGYRRATRQPFIDLELPVSGVPSLVESIRASGRSESIEGWHCDSCGRKRTARKGMSLVALPPMLCMHLKRFVYDLQVMRRVKLQQSFRFPEVLDMGSALTSEEDEEDKEEERDGDEAAEKKETDREQARAKAKQEKRVEGTGPEVPSAPLTTHGSLKSGEEGHRSGVYRLYAVLIHVGSAGGGHYFMYVCPGAAAGTRLPQGRWKDVAVDEEDGGGTARVWEAETDEKKRAGEWFECNDAHVKPLRGPDLQALLRAMDLNSSEVAGDSDGQQEDGKGTDGKKVDSEGADDKGDSLGESGKMQEDAADPGQSVGVETEQDTGDQVEDDQAKPNKSHTPEKPEQTGGPAGNAYLLLYVRCAQDASQDAPPASEEASEARGTEACAATLVEPVPPGPVREAIEGFNGVYEKLLRASRVRRAIAQVRVRGPGAQSGGERLRPASEAAGGGAGGDSPVAAASPEEKLLEASIAGGGAVQASLASDNDGPSHDSALAAAQADIWRGSSLAEATRQAVAAVGSGLSEKSGESAEGADAAGKETPVADLEGLLNALREAGEDVAGIGEDRAKAAAALLALVPPEGSSAEADPDAWRVRLRRFNSAAGVPQEPLTSVAARELDRLAERRRAQEEEETDKTKTKEGAASGGSGGEVAARGGASMPAGPLQCPLSWIGVSGATDLFLELRPADRRWAPYSKDDVVLRVVRYMPDKDPARKVAEVAASGSGAACGEEQAPAVSLEESLAAMPQVGVRLGGDGAQLGDLDRLLDALASEAGQKRVPGLGLAKPGRKVWLLDGDVLVRLVGDAEADLRREFGAYSGCTVVLEDDSPTGADAPSAPPSPSEDAEVVHATFKDRFDAERASIAISFNEPVDPELVAAAGGEDLLPPPDYSRSVTVRRTDTVRALKEAVGAQIGADPDDFYLRRSVRGAVVKDLEQIVGDPVDVLRRQNMRAAETGGKRRDGLCLVDRSIVHVCFGVQMAADEYRSKIFLLGTSVEEWKRKQQGRTAAEPAEAGSHNSQDGSETASAGRGSPASSASGAATEASEGTSPSPPPGAGPRMPGQRPVLRGRGGGTAGRKKGGAGTRFHRLCELPAKSTAPVRQLKRKICAALESRGISLPTNRIRLREKKQREGPGKILRDARPLKNEVRRLEDGLELCVQLLPEAEEVGPHDMIISLQRWRPLAMRLNPPVEVIVPKKMPILQLKELAARKLKVPVEAEGGNDPTEGSGPADSGPAGAALQTDDAGASPAAAAASSAGESAGGAAGRAGAATADGDAKVWQGVGLAKVAGYGPKPSGRTAHELKWHDPDSSAQEDPILAALGLRDGLTVMVRSEAEFKQWVAEGGPAKAAAGKGKPAGGSASGRRRKPWETGSRGSGGSQPRETGVRIGRGGGGARANAPLVTWNCIACTFENKTREGAPKVCSMCTTEN